MSNPLPLVLLASLVAGGAGAAATTILNSKPETSTVQAGLNQGNAEILAKLDSMEQSYHSVLDRLEDLEAGAQLVPVGSPTERISAVAPEVELKEAVLSVLSDMEDPTVAAATPQLERAVEAVIEMRDERRKLEREQKRAAEEEKRLEDRLAKMQTELGLDQNQVSSMRKIYQDQDAKRDELRTEMMAMRESGGGSREEMRAMWGDLRDATNQEIQGVLSPTQYESYTESYGNDRGRGRGNTDNNGGGGRGGNRNGGGRGGR